MDLAQLVSQWLHLAASAVAWPEPLSSTTSHALVATGKVRVRVYTVQYYGTVPCPSPSRARDRPGQLQVASESMIAAVLLKGLPLAAASHTHTPHGVINWRYAEHGSTLHDSNSDPVPVFAALNSAAINLAECDRDLIMGAPAAGAGGVAAGDAAAAEEEEEGEAALPGL